MALPEPSSTRRLDNEIWRSAIDFEIPGAISENNDTAAIDPAAAAADFATCELLCELFVSSVYAALTFERSLLDAARAAHCTIRYLPLWNQP